MPILTTELVRRSAPGVGVAATKNRVWGFFEDGVKRTWKIDPQVVEAHLEKTTTARKTALGVPHWPSRDPIGEAGGLNLYAMVQNNAVNQIDRLGLSVFDTVLDLADRAAKCCECISMVKSLYKGNNEARRNKLTAICCCSDTARNLLKYLSARGGSITERDLNRNRRPGDSIKYGVTEGRNAVLDSNLSSGDVTAFHEIMHQVSDQGRLHDRGQKYKDSGGAPLEKCF